MPNSTLIYPDYQPGSREAESVNEAFGAGTKLSDSQRPSETLSPQESTEPDLSERARLANSRTPLALRRR
jgi:hypothetical protein